MTNIKIGVLGGIGPEATAEFYSTLIKKLQESGAIKKNTDFPQIIINSIPAPELINEEISERDLEPYITGVKELDNIGVDFIVIVCNTIHIYYDILHGKIKTPILNLRDYVKDFLRRSGYKCIFLLATPATIRNGLYKFHGVKCLEPDENEMQKLIRSVFLFNKGKQRMTQIEYVRKIARKYLSLGVDAVLLGCTEFAVMLEGEEFPKINTIDILVDAVINNLNNQESIIKKN